mgnify:CR=1 FL=1
MYIWIVFFFPIPLHSSICVNKFKDRSEILMWNSWPYMIMINILGWIKIKNIILSIEQESINKCYAFVIKQYVCDVCKVIVNPWTLNDYVIDDRCYYNEYSYFKYDLL